MPWWHQWKEYVKYVSRIIIIIIIIYTEGAISCLSGCVDGKSSVEEMTAQPIMLRIEHLLALGGK